MNTSVKTEQKNRQQAELFKNRLAKNFKTLKKWARKNRISCYRLYDRDIPEIPLAADIYTFLPPDTESKEDAFLYINKRNQMISDNSPEAAGIIQEENQRTYLLLYLYERPYEKDDSEEEVWLDTMAEAASEILEINRESVIIKTRRKQSDGEKRSQYEKTEQSRNILRLTQEQGQLFLINLEDYLDTGLFFDHRPLRKTVRETCKGKTVLNLFCYTGSFSVYAAEGGAKRVTSVDMSNTYLEWAKKNMAANGFTDESRFSFIRQDVNGFLNQMNAEVPDSERKNRFDIIILDPPTFSNSKRTEHTLDINRDWSELVKKCLNLLNKDGILYFSTNSRRLIFDETLLPEKTKTQDITASTIPEDYRNKKIHRCWKLSLQ
ncbi:methyltransferase domain-containing protein [Treponema rectale]|uniref:23S rRNA (Cytosine1962-C5)-methyltransferase n=1 Tax=Treponema rectale TaxID=744512 RepID=A0A840SBF9_9SPIR|nr:23S rRNA (cytosine1962-C5)-methyltransferase [Treponema rectale]QOS40131.1 methyltransferase domain-containing protein [Treponema rectale]